MVPYAYQDFTAIMKKHVMDNKIRMSRIDDAVSRILRVKFEIGLFEAPYSSRRLNTFLGAPVSISLNSTRLC